MTECPCDTPPKVVLRIPAGLTALPRQTQTFPDVRRALLAAVAQKSALQGWRARGERDFGLMWLEMWAYVSDVLGFYDERIANESYLRTAVRRPSLRRIVDLLGYVPAPGTGGSATIAAIAEGRTTVAVPEHTAFRSDAFAGQAPQVFESEVDTPVHALSNSWEIGPVQVSAFPSGFHGNELIFEPTNFGLAKDRLALFTWPKNLDDATPNDPGDLDAEVRRVTAVQPFEGKDGRTYVRVTLSASLKLPSGITTEQIRVRTPTVVGVPTRHDANAVSDTEIAGRPATLVRLDTVYRQLKEQDWVIASAGSALRARVATRVEETTVQIVNTDVNLPITDVTLEPQLPGTEFLTGEGRGFTFHFNFVDAGRITRVPETEPPGSRLKTPGGVAVVGIVERPPTADANGVLEQPFLLRDADNRGALVEGRMRFKDDGTATFEVKKGDLPPTLKTPITVFGNVLSTTRGESVFNEILGSGDPRIPHQTFKLKKKPLTYIFDPTVDAAKARSTLEVRVNDVSWREVRSFFGAGPEDQVYIVRHDDAGNTSITFGDGVRGARVPAGVKNVRASYRFGSGFAAPPAGSIRQLARAVKGLRRVESPIPAQNGRDPDPPEALRTLAPKSVLLFQRAVSALDFEVLASLVTGVVKAAAEFLWIESEQQAGVLVTYIGTATPDQVLAALLPEAEPGLPLQAVPAIARAATMTIEVEVHPQFDKDLVAENVKKALIDPETGPLAKKNAPIGQRLFRSALFDVIHGVEGVVGIQAARMQRKGSFTTNFKPATSSSVCAGAGRYFDFADGADVHVTGHTAVAPVPGAGRQQPRV